jgi:hypothetical protein
MKSEKHEIVEILNDQFFSVFENRNTSRVQSTLEAITDEKCQVRSSIFSPLNVYKELVKLDKNKTAGIDGINPTLLKECAHSFSVPISLIFKMSYENSTVPSTWLEANITPIHKKGKRTDPANYRPISLTSVLCKTMERMIKNEMMCFLEKHRLISKSQHGFVKFKSCVTNLLETIDLISESINRGFAVDILFIDFMKAFDLVPHPELIAKLEAFGFQGKLLEWIKAFLTNRRQRVVLDGTASVWKDVLCGVPQGSVLGPLLFIIFINDLPDGLSILLKLFADDSKLVSVIRNSSDREEFQKNINRILEWTTKWKMELNLSKCKVMHIGNNKIHQHHHYSFEFNDSSYILSNTSSERDLGVTLQDNLKWDDHISTIVLKANNVLGRIKNSFQNWDARTFKILFTSYVRPILEYGSMAWNPHKKQDIKKIEAVQRRATKLVPTLRNKSYGERLKELGLTSLEDRRLRGDLIQFFKTDKNFNKIDWYHPIELNPSAYTSGPAGATRGQHKLYRQLIKSCPARHNFFTNRLIPYWNALPSTVKNAQSVNDFKNKLDEFVCLKGSISAIVKYVGA